jgi:hypothetical protein
MASKKMIARILHRGAKANSSPPPTAEEISDQEREVWAYGSGPGTLAGDDDL